jgi:hypothetical protein
MDTHEVKSCEISKAHSVSFRFNYSWSDTQVDNLFESCFYKSIESVYLEVVDYTKSNSLVFLVNYRKKTVVNSVLLGQE